MPDDEDLQRLFHAARKRAAYLRFKDWDADEIAQEVVLMRLEKPESRQSVVHAVVDAIRRLRGRKDTKIHEVRKNAESTYVQIENARIDIATPIDGFEFKGDVDTLCKCLMGFDRAIFLLRVKWGLSISEVASVFGVTIARVGQREAEIIERIRRNQK